MNIKELIDTAVKLEDQTKTTGSARALPPEGPTVCRFTGYTELGMQPQKDYQGTKKSPVEMVRLEFTLLNKENIREVTANGEKFTIYDRVYLTLTKLMGDKAKFKKLFNKLSNGRQITHIAQLLGEAFQVKIRYEKSKDGQKTYVSVQDSDGSFTFSPPVVEIPGQAEPIRLNVPEYSDLKLFLWGAPNRESWDALHIDGTMERDGKTYSKNFVQEMILKALDFEGSALQSLLLDTDGALNSTVNKMQGTTDLSDMNV